MSTEKQIVLITGANRGLGYYAAAQMSATGRYHVLLGSRALATATAAIERMTTDDSITADVANLAPIELDVTSDESIFAAARQVEQRHGRLDVLINNAGISRAAGVRHDLEPNGDGTDPPLRESYRQVFDANVFGVVVTTDAFLPLLRRSPVRRIVCTGSTTSLLDRALHSPDGDVLHGRNYRMYRSSKTALNMLVVSYATTLAEEGFVVTAANPGYCSTNLTVHKGTKDPRLGAAMIVKAVTLEKEICHGRVVNEEGAMPW